MTLRRNSRSTSKFWSDDGSSHQWMEDSLLQLPNLGVWRMQGSNLTKNTFKNCAREEWMKKDMIA